MRKLLVSLLLIPTLALADGKTADDYWKAGEQFYVSQDWDKAAESFLEGWKLEPDPAKKPSYLFNVAQSYRLGNRCRKAKFYYGQYLDAPRTKALKEEKRKEVEGYLAKLEDCAKQEQLDEDKKRADEAAAAQRAADEKAAAEKAARDKQLALANGNKDPDVDGPEDGVAKSREGMPKLVSARLVGGGSVLSAGALDIPLQSTGGIIAGYPLAIAPQIELDVGAAFTFAASPYKTGEMSHTVTFTTALANAGATYWLSPQMGVRADVGVGVLVLGGANESPFTADKPTTGPLSMFHVRGGVSFDYAVTPNILVTVPVAASYSPAKTGMREDISGFTRFDFMLGVGYRM